MNTNWNDPNYTLPEHDNPVLIRGVFGPLPAAWDKEKKVWVIKEEASKGANVTSWQEIERAETDCPSPCENT